MASTAVILRSEPWLEPPAIRESAARPVSVMVSTVVVRSGTASRLTVALRTPMASASRAMTASPARVFGRTSVAAAMIAAVRIRPISIAERAGDVLGMTVAGRRGEHAAEG